MLKQFSTTDTCMIITEVRVCSFQATQMVGNKRKTDIYTNLLNWNFGTTWSSFILLASELINIVGTAWIRWPIRNYEEQILFKWTLDVNVSEFHTEHKAIWASFCIWLTSYTLIKICKWEMCYCIALSLTAYYRDIFR